MSVSFDRTVLREEMEAVLAQVEEGCEQALAATALQIGAQAVSRAPAQSGALRESAVLTLDGVPAAVGRADGGITLLDGARKAGAKRAVLSFAAPYAAQVHEHTEVPHAQGEAKFLERAALCGKEIFARELCRAIAAGREDDDASRVTHISNR